jgi:hypothetical protein
VAIVHLITILVPAGAIAAMLFSVPGPVRMFASAVITPWVPFGVTELFCAPRIAARVSTAAMIRIVTPTRFPQEDGLVTLRCAVVAR